MKRIFLIQILLCITLVSFSQKSKNAIEAKALYFSATCSRPVRTEFDKYMNVIGDSLKLTNMLTAKNGYGIGAGFIIRTNKSEIEAGGGIVFGESIKGNNSSSNNTATLKTQTFDIHFGYSNYIAGPFFIGVDFGVISNNGKFTVSGSSTSLFESTPESNNPFKGYVFSVKPKAGFFFPFKKDKLSGFKLNAFYDAGLTKYDFYNKDIFSTRLKNYKGDTKSSFKGFGVQAGIIFDME